MVKVIFDSQEKEALRKYGLSHDKIKKLAFRYSIEVGAMLNEDLEGKNL